MAAPTTRTDDGTGPVPDAVKQSFGGPEAAKIVGITYRQLDHWARKGLVLPSVTAAAGSGSQRRYSYSDLLELKVIKNLRDAGLSLQRIQKAFDYIRRHLDGQTVGLRIFSDGTHVYACRSNDEVIDLLDSGQVVFGFALGRVFEELDGSIAQLRPTAETAENAAAPPEPDETLGRLAR